MKLNWLAKLFPGWPAWVDFWSTFEFGREADSGWTAILSLALVSLILFSAWVYRRDTRELSAWWKAWKRRCWRLMPAAGWWTATRPPAAFSAGRSRRSAAQPRICSQPGRRPPRCSGRKAPGPHWSCRPAVSSKCI